MKMTDDAEQSSKFLPELRAFLFGYEDILAYECGYNEGAVLGRKLRRVFP
jgi:hypothetical protein